MKNKLLVSLLFFLFIGGKAFAQQKFDSTLLQGKWRIDIMKGPDGSAVDFTSDGASEPDIYPYINFVKSKCIFSNKGKWKQEAAWRMDGQMLVITPKDKPSHSYKIIALEKEILAIEFPIEMSGGEISLVQAYYKRNK